MELINKGGMTYWIPAGSSRDVSAINSFARWEQAFRVYSNVYTRGNPHRAAELIEYNFIIHSAALNYIWDNVYQYDCDFRRHMSRHPQRSWNLILQQAWSFRLMDKYKGGDNNSRQGGSNGGNMQKKVRDRDNICWRYNRGRCTYGSLCKFEHRCAICDKWGHGAHICRRGSGSGGHKGEKQGCSDQDRHDHHDRRDGNNDKSAVTLEVGKQQNHGRI